MNFIQRLIANLFGGLTITNAPTPRPSGRHHVEGDDVNMVMTDAGPMYPR